MTKKICLTLLMFLFISFKLYGDEKEVNHRLNSNVPVAGDFKFTGSVTLSLLERWRAAWKGTFDYYLTDYWSFTGSTHLNFNKLNNARHHTGTMGLNIHPFVLGNAAFYFGGSAGYTWVVHDSLQDKLVPTVEYRLGMALHGTIFFLTAEVLFRDALYFSGNDNLDLKEVFLLSGIGVKI